jgi:hypothetical protein
MNKAQRRHKKQIKRNAKWFRHTLIHRAGCVYFSCNLSQEDNDDIEDYKSDLLAKPIGHHVVKVPWSLRKFLGKYIRQI